MISILSVLVNLELMLVIHGNFLIRSGIGVGLKYIYSNLAQGPAAGNNYKAASAVAGDLAYYYQGHNDLGQGWAFGAVLSNLGSKISYTDNADQKDYIPANLGLGTTYTRVFNSSQFN